MTGDVQAAPRASRLAYRYLNRRDRTEAELRAYLLGRELPPHEVDAAVAELAGAGYIDDARYARLFSEDKRALERWGAERIRRALGQRGIARELIEAALVDTEDGEDELTRARALLCRRFPRSLAGRRERDRALVVLIRKGFASETALDALAAHAPGGVDA